MNAPLININIYIRLMIEIVGTYIVSNYNMRIFLIYSHI